VEPAPDSLSEAWEARKPSRRKARRSKIRE
jgi:hypothetical protein